MALEGIGQQQNTFAIAFGDIMARRKEQELLLRKSALQNFVQTMLQRYQKKHEEELAARKQKQAMTMQIGAIAALFAGPALGGDGGGGGGGGGYPTFGPPVG